MDTTTQLSPQASIWASKPLEPLVSNTHNAIKTYWKWYFYINSLFFLIETISQNFPTSIMFSIMCRARSQAWTPSDVALKQISKQGLSQILLITPQLGRRKLGRTYAGKCCKPLAFKVVYLTKYCPMAHQAEAPAGVIHLENIRLPLAAFPTPPEVPLSHYHIFQPEFLLGKICQQHLLLHHHTPLPDTPQKLQPLADLRPDFC